MNEIEQIRAALEAAARKTRHHEDNYEVCYDWCPACRIASALALLPALEQRLAELTRDRERMDWLAKHADCLDRTGYGADDWWWSLLHHDGNQAEGATLRKCIDAARAGEETR